MATNPNLQMNNNTTTKNNNGSKIDNTIKKNNTTKKNNNVILPKSSITKKISLKNYRSQAVDRTAKMVKMLPAFIKFIKKLTPSQISSLKYYKGFGSYLQTNILTHNSSESKILQKRELFFPFYKEEDMTLLDDIGTINQSLQFPLWLPNMNDIPSYINNSYGIRINLLNILDTVFNHPECPKLTEDIILFRGMKTVPDKRKIKAGETFTYYNFISTTFDRLVAEHFANTGYVFVLTGFQNIPCVFTPGNKQSGPEKTYVNAIIGQNINYDLSELTLPRGLEFKINKVDMKYMSNLYRHRNRNTYGKLLRIFNKRDMDNISEPIEDALYNKITFVYCSFVRWIPQQPIDFKLIKKNAKFVLDMDALKSWNERDYFDDESD